MTNPIQITSNIFFFLNLETYKRVERVENETELVLK